MNETNEEMLQIGFRGTAEFRRKLQAAALDRNLKVQGLIELLVDRYVFSDGENTSPLETSLNGANKEELVVAQHFLQWMRSARAKRDSIVYPAYEMVMKYIGIHPETLAPIPRKK